MSLSKQGKIEFNANQTSNQRGEYIMTQGMLPFQYENEKDTKKMTGFGGAGVYLDLFKALGLENLFDRKPGLNQGSQGYSDSEICLSFVLLHLLGGECVDDIDRLESDAGLAYLFKKYFKKKGGNRFRRPTERVFPSSSVLFRYLEKFDIGEEALHEKGIFPVGADQLAAFQSCNKELLARLQRNLPQKTATLDQDATLVEAAKNNRPCTVTKALRAISR